MALDGDQNTLKNAGHNFPNVLWISRPVGEGFEDVVQKETPKKKDQIQPILNNPKPPNSR
jgi:hypothetical protein